jgi:hypothetical protein
MKPLRTTNLLRLSLLGLLCFAFAVPAALAQTSCTIRVNAQPANTLADLDDDPARLFSITFTDIRDRLILPDQMLTLDCSSTGDDALAIDVSPAVSFGEAIPEPDNPDSIIDNYPGYAIVNTSRANVRSGDDVAFKRVAIVNGGTPLVVLGRNANQSWWYVQVDDIRGWMSSEVIVLRGDLTDVPIVETVNAQRTEPTLYVGFPGNAIVSEVSINGSEVCRLVGRAEHLVLGRNVNGNWYKITGLCRDGVTREGWIQAELGALRNPGGVRLPVLP